jgi:hypothetical protein
MSRRFAMPPNKLLLRTYQHAKSPKELKMNPKLMIRVRSELNHHVAVTA